MKVLIIGLGSIAKKHIQALRSIHPEAQVTALRSSSNASVIDGVENVSGWENLKQKFDFIIISNPTGLHKEAILEALKLNCPLFIEKPVLADLKDGEEILARLEIKSQLTYVACNLRFHSCLLFLKKLLQKRQLRINEVNVYCGSDLSQWRPGQNYWETYSAKKDLGGGVHLDLIHEIDYCYWLFGKPDEVIRLGRKVSPLKIDSIDFSAYHLCYPGFTVNVVLNYYRKRPKRSIEIVAEEGTFCVDLIKASVFEEDQEIFSDAQFNMQTTYEQQMNYFIESVQHKKTMMNDFSEALEVLKIVIN